MKKDDFTIRPIYILLLIMAAAYYVANVCAMHADLYKKIGRLEHKLMHMGYGRETGCEATDKQGGGR